MKSIRRGLSVGLSFVLLWAFMSFSEENSRTAILGALDEELVLLEEQLMNGEHHQIEGIQFTAGNVRGRPIVLARTGAGKVNAAMITTLLIEHFQPAEVIYTGIAGGVNSELLPGDIVIAARTAQHDLGSLTADGILHWGVRNPINGERNPVFFPADARLVMLAERSAGRVAFEHIDPDSIDRAPKVVTGTVVTGDVFVSSAAKRMELRQRLQADAVEMEGAAVAQICWQRGIPCLVIRCLSDTADENADRDYRNFYRIAAENSARLVVDLVAQLATRGSPEGQ